MQKCFGDPKRLFLARNYILDHFRPNGRPYCGKSKIHKIAKKSILAKNSNACRMADIGRNDDIWPEMGSKSVLESFCTKNHYSNPNRSYFKQFSKNRFFSIFHLWDPPEWDLQNILWVSKFLYDVGKVFRYIISLSKTKGGS